MAIVADAARPVGAYPPPVRHGTCRLTIRIHHTEYRLRPCPPETGILAAWVLRKLDHDSARYLVTAPKGKPAACTCPDHERSGWTCKHIGALMAAGLIPAPKPSSARNRKLHAKNARQAIAEVAQAPVPIIMPEGWQPGGQHPSFAAGFRQAVRAHVAKIGRGGYEICEGCGADFDPEISGHPGFCFECTKEGDA
jgi:SWIM zinc finger